MTVVIKLFFNAAVLIPKLETVKYFIRRITVYTIRALQQPATLLGHKTINLIQTVNVY